MLARVTKRFSRWDWAAVGVSLALLAVVVWSVATHMRYIALVEQMSSWNNEQALAALDTFRVRGWLDGGQMDRALVERANLRGADFSGANLEGIYFVRTNLRGADFSGATLRGAVVTNSNLTGAEISEEQLARLSRLQGTILPDGALYDGRYRLPGDEQQASWNRVDLDDDAALAEWYGVPLETYLEGQAWADANLTALRQATAPPPPERLRVNWTHVTVGLSASVGLSLVLGGWLTLRGPFIFKGSEES